ncbi:MAG: AAA family ATPase [Ramlibacter sp.]
MALTIALLGAESTGKSTLAPAMAAALQARGHRAVAVPEVLRTWCDREGRTPRPEEQLRIAQAQERQVDAALARADIVIADTTALMVAIYSGMLFEDGSLYRFALERQRRYGLTLVTGLDLPWVADGLQRTGPQVRAPADALVRDALHKAGVAYRVVYGRGEERTRNALAPVLALLGESPPQPPRPRRWASACDKCSDPACEHRLFTALRGR